ncbi:uncharacterized protein [Ptychodera flava]|uniref:uncharacterized protein n=1 Tax=Ptychodera flava TaxID=63121 RepID=UPI00396AA3EE
MKLLWTFIHIALLINRHSCIPRISMESGDIVDDNTTHAHITQTVSASPTTSSGNSDSYYVQDFVAIDKDTLLCLYPGSDQRLDSCLTPTGSICNGMKTAKLHEKEIVLCSCQPQCLLSEDCCYDFMDVCIRNSENPPTLDDLWPSSYCLSRPDMYDIVIIHRCQREWSDDEFRKKCEKTNDTSVLDLTPVFTLSDHDVYQNIYCAVCNGIDPSAVQFLPLQWSCDIPRRTKAEIWHILRQHNISSAIATVQKIPDCKLTVGVPNDVQEKLPICVNYIKECPSDFGDLNLVQRCQNFTANIQVGSATSIRFALRFYKNIHCALCNEPQVNLSEIFCGIPADYTGFQRLPSFNVLFDFTAQGFQRVFAHGDYYTEQWNCDHDEMFDMFLEKCVKKVRYPQSEFENRASIVNTRSMSRDMISWYILLTFHISFPSQNVRPALTEFERNVTSFIRRSLPLNNMISISESELQLFNAQDATITLKVDVESTSNVFTEEILPSACMRTWADSESEVSMVGAEIQSVTFELPNGNCSNMTDRVTLKGSIFEYNNETLNEDEVANITWHPVFTFSHFMSKSCFYERESSNLQNIAIEMVMCISKSDEDDETPFTCANGVILKLAADDFEITEGILVVDSSIYPEDQFVLSDDQSYAYICHINQKVASFWNTSSKTKLKQLLTLIGCILSIIYLVVSIITICAFKQMRTRPGKIILNLAIALVTVQLLFITVMDVVHILGCVR